MKIVEWRIIPGFESYAVSSDGRIMSFPSASRGKRAINGILKPKPGGYKKTYFKVSLYKDKMARDFYIHKLVLSIFGSPQPEGMQCAHIDGNPHNNNIDNLMWATPAENSQHKILHGTSGKGERNSMARISDNDVFTILRRIYLGNSAKDIAHDYGVCASTILSVAAGRTFGHICQEEREKFNIKQILKNNMAIARDKSNAKRMRKS